MQEVQSGSDSVGARQLEVSNGNGHRYSPEQVSALLAALAEPFDPEVVEWRVTNTAPSKHGYRGQVVAYADQRAYTDRLNALFTPLGWTRDYSVQTVQNFERPAPGQAKTTIITAKVMVTCKVAIFGLGAHSGTGEEWATDENALTRAEAQAFKRACSCFGLGRYFYDLPRTWVDLDDNRRPLEVPGLPEWARPKRPSRPVAATSGNGKRTNGAYGKELLQAVRELADEVGFSLTAEVVRRFTGKQSLDQVTDPAKLTLLMDKLDDLARGVRRLAAATEGAGQAAYDALCRELNLPSNCVEDIPSREVLRQLVERMEAAVQGDGANGNASAVRIGDLRGRLLQEARRVSQKTQRGLAEVVAAASGGAITLARISGLTDADGPEVEATIGRLQQIVTEAVRLAERILTDLRRETRYAIGNAQSHRGRGTRPQPQRNCPGTRARVRTLRRGTGPALDSVPVRRSAFPRRSRGRELRLVLLAGQASRNLLQR